MGNSLSSVVSNIFMEHFMEIALVTTDHKPAKQLRYVNDTFVVWPHGPARSQQFLHHLNSIRPTIKFTMEFPFLDILLMKRGSKSVLKVYRKPTHTGFYLHFKSNHPYHVKRGTIHSLIRRTKTICQDQKDFINKIKNIRLDLMLNEYRKEFIDSVMKPSRSNHPSSDIPGHRHYPIW
jgi:hypothetical protein